MVVNGASMKIKTKINLYNFLTVVFAILTFVSLGGANGEVELIRAIMNVVTFSFLTYICYERENQLREMLRIKRNKNKKVKLSVYKSTTTTTHPAA